MRDSGPAKNGSDKRYILIEPDSPVVNEVKMIDKQMNRSVTGRITAMLSVLGVLSVESLKSSLLKRYFIISQRLY